MSFSDPFPQYDFTLHNHHQKHVIPEESSIPSLGQLDNFPTELLVAISSNLCGMDLYILGQVNSTFLKLLFNQTRDRILNRLIPLKNIGKQEALDEFSRLNQRSVALEYIKDQELEEFNMVQEQIWKLLVCHYFPRFRTGLPVKNWMHILRKRIAHLKVNSPHYLPLRRHEPIKRPFMENQNGTMKSYIQTTLISNYHNPYEINEIENCEWIYKCPVSFESMVNEDGEKRFCNGCGKHVYRVYDQHDIEYHSNLGHCVALVKPLEPLLPPVLGVPIWFPPAQ